MPIHDDTEHYSETTRKLQPKRINTRHRALMRRLLSGMTVGQAADDIGMNRGRASVIINSPLFQAEMKEMSEDIKREFVESEGHDIQKCLAEAREKLMQASPNAAQVLVDGLSNEKERQLSAKEILDRVGVKGKEEFRGSVQVEAGPSLAAALEQLSKRLGEDESLREKLGHDKESRAE